ncbi:hypothetical protein XENTR_v10019229 [Xenopus tropicalis]|nr:hypothetical protein XENTR_v10019229 [Xenopus tropicalis]
MNSGAAYFWRPIIPPFDQRPLLSMVNILSYNCSSYKSKSCGRDGGTHNAVISGGGCAGGSIGWAATGGRVPTALNYH